MQRGGRTLLTPRNWVPEATAQSLEGLADPGEPRGKAGAGSSGSPPIRSALTAGLAPATRQPLLERGGPSAGRSWPLGFGKAEPFHLPLEAERELRRRRPEGTGSVRGTEALARRAGYWRWGARTCAVAGCKSWCAPARTQSRGALAGRHRLGAGAGREDLGAPRRSRVCGWRVT